MTLRELAEALRVPLWMLVAIRYVESGGNPRAMRFEPHLFKKRRPHDVVTIPRDLPPAQAQAVRLDAWRMGRIPYTPGHNHDGLPRAASSIAAETDRAAFERARALDVSDAVLSSSWGSYQVLGGQFDEILPQHQIVKSDGDADLAVRLFDSDPEGVSLAMLGGWLRDNPKALSAARRGDIPGFVERYNGAKDEQAAPYIRKMEHARSEFDAGRMSA